MSMEMNAWTTMRGVVRGQNGRRPVSRGTVRRIARFARPQRTRIITFVVASVVTSVLAVSTPVLAGAVVDAIVGGDSRTRVVLLAVAIAVVALVEAAFGLVNRWQSARIGEQLIFDLRTAVFDHVQRLSVAFFTRTRTGALVSRLNSDVLGAQRAFSDTLAGLVSNLVTLLLTLAIMLTISWQITLLALLLLPIFLLPARRMGGRIASLEREAADHNAAMSSRMTERFSAPGATLVALHGRPDDEAAQFADRADRVRAIGVRVAVMQAIFMTALVSVSAMALALVYGVGGVAALSGVLEPGAVVALALLLTRLYGPLTALSNAHVDVLSALVAFDRIFEILDLDPLVRQRADARPVPAGPLSVELDDVRLAYPTATDVSLASLEDVAALDDRGGVEVLHGVSLRAEPGEVIGIVGTSGAGKSTLAQLLPRLYDVTGGAVRVGGVDVRDLELDSLRRAVGLVTQDGHLFHDTVRENLRIAAPEAGDDLIWRALADARLESVVRALPDGLDTVLGERGYRLSGGERQRLTIARLLLAQARIIVLDEATAHLDSTSEAAVQAALATALEGRTALVIAHRLSTIRDADRIVVVEDGRVAESGTHRELLALDGRYAELYATQAAGVTDVPAA